MKKLYSLLLLAVTTVSFGQIFSDNLNYTDAALLTDNGWTAHSGGTTNPIDVGASNGLTYTGYSGLTGYEAAVEGNAALLDQNGQDVNKTFLTPVTSGTLYYSFLVNVTSGDAGYFTHIGTSTNFAARIFVKPSTTSGKINFGISNTGTASFAAVPTDYDLNTTYLIIVKYDVSTTGAASIWVRSTGIPATETTAGTPEHTTSGSGQASINAVYLRQYVATQNITIDGLLVYATWFGTTPCSLTLGNGTTACNAITPAIDTYNVTFAYTGGNTGSYTLATNAGTIGGNNPSTTAAGDITISNIPEGTNVTLTVTGACSFSKLVTAPECKPVNALPYSEGFPYTVGNSLGLEQKWTNVNTGDNVVVSAGSLTYAGVTSTGDSVTFNGAGIDCFTPFTATTAGTIYAAFLFNVTELQGVTDGNSTYFATLTDDLKGFKGRLFLKRTGPTFQIGLDVASTTTNLDGNLINIGETVYIVMGYDFTSNLLDVWINPTNGAAPTLGLVPVTPFANLGGFLLRQDAANTTPTIVFDELRVVTSLADLGLNLSTKSNTITGLNVYPNPVTNGKLYITSDSGADKTVVIYDILGKQVINTTVMNDVVNVSGLNAGVYIVKITEAGNTATRKLIIR